ncbi:MAG TPA: cytochrome C oxidase subunit IV family protein [Saprospiraceae bacterium]|nr:cytochrome C oxidase subunit IV family protein [Saprospiraceae bacterium]
MAHLSYEQSKTIATKTIIVLGIITIVEVLFALLGKGYLVEGFYLPLLLVGFVMIILSAYKAYLIVYEFMHMKYEVPSLVRTVLLPTALLIWAIIAFFWEGKDWHNRRAHIQQKNQEEVQPVVPQGDLYEIKKEDLIYF